MIAEWEWRFNYCGVERKAKEYSWDAILFFFCVFYEVTKARYDAMDSCADMLMDVEFSLCLKVSIIIFPYSKMLMVSYGLAQCPAALTGMMIFF